MWRHILKVLVVLLVFIAIVLTYILLTLREMPRQIRYGATFSTMYAEELGLNWREVYIAMLDDLQVRDIRIPAYWERIEAEKDTYDWSELDFMLREARVRDADVVLAIGRRVPRWPECHIPAWAETLPWEEQKVELRDYMTALIERYKDNPAVEYWQVENEPYLGVFAPMHCGKLDKAFLEEEFALVRSLDTRPILVTDSGNLGAWWGPYKHGDAFGTSLYIYFWTPNFGQYRTYLPPLFYRAKDRLMSIFHGEKPSILIELALEPWLMQPIKDTPIDVQLTRMDQEKFDEIIEYASRTGFEKQYLWGVEWWYYMAEREHPEFWDSAQTLYESN